jgi:preprotein translocase subunit SecD
MFSNIRNRLIIIVALVGLSVFSLVPRNVTQRVRSENGTMKDTVVRRVPIKRGLDLQGGIYLALEIDESQGRVQDREDAIDRALTVVRTRIDEFGVTEPLIQKVGNDRIVVQLAGIDDPGRAKQIVQRTAFLEWRITDMDERFRGALPAIDRALVRAGVRAAPGAEAVPSAVEQLLGTDSQVTAADTGIAEQGASETLDRPGPLSSYLYTGSIPGEFLVEEEQYLKVDSVLQLDVFQRAKPRGIDLFWGLEPISQGSRPYRPLYAVEDRSVITGEYLTDATATIDPGSRNAIVRFELTRRGGRVFARETAQHVDDYMAIILDGRVHRQPPIIRSRIGRSGQIELGTVALQEAQDLALVLRAGALPAKLQIVEERAVGPSLGRDSIKQGTRAGAAAAVMVILVMAFYYRRAGLLAIAALAFYVLFTLGGLASIGATLTLPGLAGFVLSLGMAVDANVLIFERIREELKLDKTARSAVEVGFRHAMPAIIDSNVTTVITAAFLFQFGTGPVKGFAVTLIIGIVASVITAVFVTHTFFLIWLQRRKATEEFTI